MCIIRSTDTMAAACTSAGHIEAELPSASLSLGGRGAGPSRRKVINGLTITTRWQSSAPPRRKPHKRCCLTCAAGLLAPPRCTDQNEHDTDDSSDDQDGQSDLHPDPEVTDCRLDPVPPRIWEHAATLFDQGVDRSLPPSEVLGRVEPEVPVSSEHDQCGPESEELDSHPGPHSSDIFH